jgi:hypothetical protein
MYVTYILTPLPVKYILSRHRCHRSLSIHPSIPLATFTIIRRPSNNNTYRIALLHGRLFAATYNQQQYRFIARGTAQDAALPFVSVRQGQAWIAAAAACERAACLSTGQVANSLICFFFFTCTEERFFLCCRAAVFISSKYKKKKQV